MVPPFSVHIPDAKSDTAVLPCRCCTRLSQYEYHTPARRQGCLRGYHIWWEYYICYSYHHIWYPITYSVSIQYDINLWMTYRNPKHRYQCILYPSQNVLNYHIQYSGHDITQRWRALHQVTDVNAWTQLCASSCDNKLLFEQRVHWLEFVRVL